MRAKEMLYRHQFFSTNKQYVKIKLMQNETNLSSIISKTLILDFKNLTTTDFFLIWQKIP